MRLSKLFLLGVTTEVTLATDDGTWSKEDFQKNLADKVDKMPDNIEKIEHEQHPEEKRIELLKREYLEPIPWKAVYLEDPLDIMDDKKPDAPADFKSRVNLPDMNRQWITNQEQRGEERLEEIFRMNNIEYTVPMTPHAIYNFVEESDFCWVMLFYTTENKTMIDFNQHYVFAQSVAQYFKERCMVGTINMDYPANRATFFEAFYDNCVPTDVDHGTPSWPCLLVRKPGYKTKMLTDRIVDGSFELADMKQWGFAVSADQLREATLQKTLKKILSEVYEPQNDFQKMHSIYMPWYHKLSIHTVHKEIMNYILEQKYKPNIDAGGMPPNKGMIMDYLYDNPQIFKNNLLARGLLTIPAPLPGLLEKFNHDEL